MSQKSGIYEASLKTHYVPGLMLKKITSKLCMSCVCHLYSVPIYVGSSGHSFPIRRESFRFLSLFQNKFTYDLDGLWIPNSLST